MGYYTVARTQPQCEQNAEERSTAVSAIWSDSVSDLHAQVRIGVRLERAEKSIQMIREPAVLSPPVGPICGIRIGGLHNGPLLSVRPGQTCPKLCFYVVTMLEKQLTKSGGAPYENPDSAYPTERSSIIDRDPEIASPEVESKVSQSVRCWNTVNRDLQVQTGEEGLPILEPSRCAFRVRLGHAAHRPTVSGVPAFWCNYSCESRCRRRIGYAEHLQLYAESSELFGI